MSQLVRAAADRAGAHPTEGSWSPPERPPTSFAQLLQSGFRPSPKQEGLNAVLADAAHPMRATPDSLHGNCFIADMSLTLVYMNRSARTTVQELAGAVSGAVEGSTPGQPDVRGEETRKPASDDVGVGSGNPSGLPPGPAPVPATTDTGPTGPHRSPPVAQEQSPTSAPQPEPSATPAAP